MRPELERRLAVLVEPLERAVLDGVRELEGEPDRVRVELGLVPVFVDERPLIGLAGLLDWRSSGRLSAIVRSSFFTGAADEQLLMPGERRWPIDRLVLIGIGSRGEFDVARARRLASRCIEIATGLAAETVLIALPSGEIERGLVEAAFDSLLDAIERSSIAPTHDAPTAEAEVAEAAEAKVTEAAEADVTEAAEADVTEAAEADAEVPEPEAAEVDAPKPEMSDVAPVDADALASQPEAQPDAANSPDTSEPRWWVVADAAVVARLRRVRSGPPRAADVGPSLYT